MPRLPSDSREGEDSRRTDPPVFTTNLCRFRSTSVKTRPSQPGPSLHRLLSQLWGVPPNPSLLFHCLKNEALRAGASGPLQSVLYPVLQLHFVPLDTTPSVTTGHWHLLCLSASCWSWPPAFHPSGHGISGTSFEGTSLFLSPSSVSAGLEMLKRLKRFQ